MSIIYFFVSLKESSRNIFEFGFTSETPFKLGASQVNFEIVSLNRIGHSKVSELSLNSSLTSVYDQAKLDSGTISAILANFNGVVGDSDRLVLGTFSLPDLDAKDVDFEVTPFRDGDFILYNNQRLIPEIEASKPPLPELSIAPLSAEKEEGNSDSTNFTFTVTRSGDLSAKSSARWTVAGSGDKPADASDFLNGRFPSGTVRFLAGQQARTITVRVAGDTTVEPDETFSVSLSRVTGASLNPDLSSAIGTIRNDDASALPELAIGATDADKPEGFSGNTPFTFTVTRSGDTSAASSARWAVTGIGVNPADAADFARGVLPAGTVRFSAGQTSRTITVNVRADLDREPDERFRVTLSNPTGATIATSRATGIIRNDDLIGTTANDTITGTSRPEFIDGLAGQDTLTGGEGSDVFGFRFGHSRIRTPDLITDFRFGEDKIALFNANGRLLPAPVAFSRAANNRRASTLAALAKRVFADADGRTAGAQPLAANAAALVRSTNAAIAGTYLLINDRNAGRSLTADLMVNITGFSGTLPALGGRPVESVFA